MREMRVGWRLKTKDGLLDIWTTALLDISRCLGGALLMGLRLWSVSLFQTVKE